MHSGCILRITFADYRRGFDGYQISIWYDWQKHACRSYLIVLPTVSGWARRGNNLASSLQFSLAMIKPLERRT